MVVPLMVKLSLELIDPTVSVPMTAGQLKDHSSLPTSTQSPALTPEPNGPPGDL